MNDQLQAELANIITNINNGASSAWGFITEQTPDVIQQLLMWHGLRSGVLCLFGLLTVLVIVAINMWQIRYWKKHGEIEPWIMGNIFQIFWAIPLSEFLNLTWLQIWVAPKVWLLEYVSSMVK